MAQENKLSTICERVLNRCLAPSTAGGEGCDNMTMILVQFKKPIKSAAPADEEASASNQSDVVSPIESAVPADEKASTSNQSDFVSPTKSAAPADKEASASYQSDTVSPSSPKGESSN